MLTFLNVQVISFMQNLTVERMWPEVNHRVNYPVKRKLIEMEDRGLIDMEIPTVKFCVSFVSVNVTAQGLKLFVQAWNAHPVAGWLESDIQCHTLYQCKSIHSVRLC